jgi:hypothetical protein
MEHPQEEKKKKSWLSGLSDLVFEPSTEEASTNEEIPQDSTSTPITQATAIPVSAVPQSILTNTSTGDGVFDQKFNEAFQELIAENNIPGVDYFEFRQALDNMANVPGLTEAASFQIAYSNLKVSDQGLDKNKLTSSIDHYDGILVNEEKEFNDAMQSEMSKEVDSKKGKALDLAQENENLLAKIKEINEKIAENQTLAIQLNNEAAMAEVKINQTAKNFSATLASVRGKLSEDKQKINSLIQ